MGQAYCTEQTQNILLGRNSLFYMGSLSRSQLVQMGAEVVSGLLANWAATLKTARIAERKGWLESVLDFDWSSIFVCLKKPIYGGQTRSARREKPIPTQTCNRHDSWTSFDIRALSTRVEHYPRFRLENEGYNDEKIGSSCYNSHIAYSMRK